MRHFKLIATATVLAPFLVLSPSSAQVTPVAAGPPSTAGQLTPPASLMPDSMFSHPVPANWPVAADSSALVAQLVTDYTNAYGSVGLGARPIFWVPANQPLVPLVVQPGCNNFLPSTGTTAPVPWWAPSSPTGDSPLEFYQPSTNSLWELWQARPVTTSTGGQLTNYGGWSACWGGKASLSTTTGVFPVPYGQSATGIEDTATEITQADVASAAIRHTIGMTVVGCNGYVYPADRGDCSDDPGQIPEGTWFRWPASVPCSGDTPLANMVCAAGKTYGFVVVDQAGVVQLDADVDNDDWYLEGNAGAIGYWHSSGSGCCIYTGGGSPMDLAMTNAAGVEEQEYQAVANLPWGQLQVVVPS
jgi:hypothetical protein